MKKKDTKKKTTKSKEKKKQKQTRKPRKKETKPRNKSIDISPYIAYAVQRGKIMTMYGTMPKGIKFWQLVNAMPNPTINELVKCGGLIVSKNCMPQIFCKKNPDIFKKNDGIVALTEKAIRVIYLRGGKEN